MKVTVDRSRPVSIHQQLRGAIENEISFGGMGPGTALPSVRDLAEQVGVAPMTVSKVYAELKAAGLVEGRSGSGTYVADSPLARLAGRAETAELRRDIDAVIDKALTLGFDLPDITALLTARAGQRSMGAGARDIVLVGLFPEATRSYAACVQDQVGALAAVTPVTFDALAADPALLERVRGADLVLTFSTLHDRLTSLVAAERTLSLRFIPSEPTRLALASLDPMARVAVISRFADFLPVLGLGVRRFAAHVRRVELLDFENDDLGHALRNCDVVVMSTGADAVIDLAPTGTPVIEYRHIPDPGDIDRLVLPALIDMPRSTPGARKEAS
ncbi:MAG: GntR family transcriptional regulator [Limimaricola sp.]|uniref:GntR family transcriptional regulator n=1 Tax=Limimaricola sp. TaxID=2211665 RepID=UPI001E12C556|nr:GntR family transcriptional regulator [Limimaricola sp.]MBI1417042.1 GntR family transcriptional regulator [Limimaricola sp.]